MQPITSTDKNLQLNINPQSSPLLPLEILIKIFSHHSSFFFIISKKITFSACFGQAIDEENQSLQKKLENYLLSKVQKPCSEIVLPHHLQTFPFADPFEILKKIREHRDSTGLLHFISNPCLFTPCTNSKINLVFNLWIAVLEMGQKESFLSLIDKVMGELSDEFINLFFEEEPRISSFSTILREIKELHPNSTETQEEFNRISFVALSLAISFERKNETIALCLLDKFPEFKKVLVWCQALAYYAWKGDSEQCSYYLEQFTQFGNLDRSYDLIYACKAAAENNHRHIIQLLLKFRIRNQQPDRDEFLFYIFETAYQFKQDQLALWVVQNYQQIKSGFFLYSFRDLCLARPPNLALIEMLLPYFSEKAEHQIWHEILSKSSMPVLKLLIEYPILRKMIELFWDKEKTFPSDRSITYAKVFFARFRDRILALPEEKYLKFLKREIRHPLGLLCAFELVHASQQQQKTRMTLKAISDLEFQNYDYYLELWKCLKKGPISADLIRYVLQKKIYIPKEFKLWLIEQIYHHLPDFCKDLLKPQELLNWTYLKDWKVLILSETDPYIIQPNVRLITCELLCLGLDQAIKENKVIEAERYATKITIFSKSHFNFDLEPFLSFFCRHSKPNFFKANKLDSLILGEKFLNYIKIACRYNNFSVVEFLLEKQTISEKLYNKFLAYARFWGYSELEQVLLNTNK